MPGIPGGVPRDLAKGDEGDRLAAGEDRLKQAGSYTAAAVGGINGDLFQVEPAVQADEPAKPTGGVSWPHPPRSWLATADHRHATRAAHHVL